MPAAGPTSTRELLQLYAERVSEKQQIGEPRIAGSRLVALDGPPVYACSYGQLVLGEAGGCTTYGDPVSEL